MRRHPSITTSVTVAALALTWAMAPGARADAPRPDAGWEAEGRRVYQKACAACHGERGDGRGPGAEQLANPVPRDFTKGAYKFRSTASGDRPLPEDLLRTIGEGIPGTVMPGWKQHLSLDERRAVADYVLGFAPRPDEPPERLVPPERELVIPPSTPALVAKGRQIYENMKCAPCHGDKGRGDGPANKTLKNDDGRKTVALDFTVGLYKGGARPFDVYRTFVTGVTGTPMPSYADALPSEEERWALVWYVLSLSRKPGLGTWLFGVQTNWK